MISEGDHTSEAVERGLVESKVGIVDGNFS